MSKPESTPPTSPERSPPAVTRGVVFFYYQDLAAAANWYRRVLASTSLVELDWVVILRIGAGDFFLGLVDSARGTLKAGADKPVLLSIETPALEEWLQRVSALEPTAIVQGIAAGGHGLVEQFLVRDPEGYLVEFFRWRTDLALALKPSAGSTPG